VTLSQPERIACPVCGAARAPDIFYDLRAVPVTGTSIFDTAAAARAVPTGDVELTTCAHCGFVFSATFDQALGHLSARYESSQAASTHFSAFAHSLADDWVQRYRLAGKTVLEIGCGGGHFLGVLRQHGVGTAIGMDPFADVSAPSRDPGVQLIADSFDARSLQLQADALVCRHTLEHIQDVSGFLRLLREWTGGDRARVLLFEVPDAQRVFAERAFWDVYYEHCNYFTATTLRYAFESAGFDVLRVNRVYDDQYLIIEAVARKAGVSAPMPAAAAEARAACQAFGHQVRASIEHCRRELQRLSGSAPPLVLWQGAAKTVGFLAALGGANGIDSAIDLSPARHGKFLPGSALAVHAPKRLLELRPGNVVLMNPVYLAEVTAQVRSLGLDTHVHSVNDLLAPQPDR
jgi:SAM-dependent methyltransferase